MHIEKTTNVERLITVTFTQSEWNTIYAALCCAESDCLKDILSNYEVKGVLNDRELICGIKTQIG